MKFDPEKICYIYQEAETIPAGRIILKGASPPCNFDEVSISMPTTPTGPADPLTPGVAENSAAATAETVVGTAKAKFYCQSMSRSVAHVETSTGMNIPLGHVRNPALDRLRDARFDSFKTWSGRLERQLSHLRGKHVEQAPEQIPHESEENEALPVDRYFDALEGPELDTLRVRNQLRLTC